MHERYPLSGELQIQIMAALWRLRSGTVEDVRTAMAPRRNAYNTVQTSLNRLVERRLLTRERRGRAYIYRPKLSEADYVARSIRRALARASSTARKTALAQLIAELDESELAQLQDMARKSGNRDRWDRAAGTTPDRRTSSAAAFRASQRRSQSSLSESAAGTATT
jgi:BlaI family transcriptional regulator, penicillinase repressor